MKTILRKSFTEFFFEIFLKSSVSRIVPKNVKEEALWDFLNVHSVAKYQKLKEGPFGDIKKIAKKSLTKPKLHAQKN